MCPHVSFWRSRTVFVIELEESELNDIIYTQGLHWQSINWKEAECLFCLCPFCVYALSDTGKQASELAVLKTLKLMRALIGGD